MESAAESQQQQAQRHTVSYENLSMEEIEDQLRMIAQSRADLEKALEEKRQHAKHELAQHIRELISEHGYDVSEIAPLVAVKKRRGASGKGGRRYTRYVDPDDPGNVYSRGVIPGWMKQKMLDQGYDPSSKSDREAFKVNSLHVLEG
jgi:DNA-binding protein H-NS